MASTTEITRVVPLQVGRCSVHGTWHAAEKEPECPLCLRSSLSVQRGQLNELRKTHEGEFARLGRVIRGLRGVITRMRKRDRPVRT